MIIKIIPETDEEKSKMQEEEHIGVNEIFLFGSKKDEDSDSIDFHFWTSKSYRTLMGGLAYYFELISDERRDKNIKDKKIKSTFQPKMIKYGEKTDLENLEKIEEAKTEDATNVLKFIKDYEEK